MASRVLRSAWRTPGGTAFEITHGGIGLGPKTSTTRSRDAMSWVPLDEQIQDRAVDSGAMNVAGEQ